MEHEGNGNDSETLQNLKLRCLDLTNGYNFESYPGDCFPGVPFVSCLEDVRKPIVRSIDLQIIVKLIHPH